MNSKKNENFEPAYLEIPIDLPPLAKKEKSITKSDDQSIVIIDLGNDNGYETIDFNIL